MKLFGSPNVSSWYERTLQAFCAAGKNGRESIATMTKALLFMSLPMLSQKAQHPRHSGSGGPSQEPFAGVDLLRVKRDPIQTSDLAIRRGGIHSAPMAIEPMWQ